ncbi:MAG: hypothetical protein ACI4MQ_07490 [Candidatus Coproplasma sp.]
MKKISKIVVGITMAAAVAATAGVIAGCSSDKTGEAYGLTHRAGYVGYSKIVVNGDKVKDLVLTEVCLPDHVTVTTGTSTVSAAEAEAAITTTVSANDYVVVTTSKTADEVTTYTATAYYKTVTVGSTTFTYDATDGYKTADGATIVSWLGTEANCKAYYEAVTTNAVKVKLGAEEKTDVMNKANLSKEENGYWERTGKDGNTYSRWKMNRDATVNYVKTYGTANLTSLVKATDKVADTKEDKQVTYWMDGTISTGATWSDLNPATSDGYFSYAELIVKANEAAK